MFINNPGHMTKMAATPIYGKTLPNASSSEPLDRFQRNKHQGLKHDKVYICHYPIMILTNFKARTSEVTCKTISLLYRFPFLSFFFFYFNGQ